jgi:ankyrin repeat protein
LPQKKNPELVKLLLDAGADPYAEDICGSTALQIANNLKLTEIEDLIKNAQKELTNGEKTPPTSTKAENLEGLIEKSKGGEGRY